MNSVEEYNISSPTYRYPTDLTSSRRIDDYYRKIQYSTLVNYGILNFNFYNVIDSSDVYLNHTNDYIHKNLLRKKDSIYNFQTNRFFSQYNFDIINQKIGSAICNFYGEYGKTLEMIDNYGIIYSGTTNMSTVKHNFDCDIIINLCLRNTLAENQGVVCFYKSLQSSYSREKNNIRVTLGLSNGDIIIHKGSHETQIFSISSVEPEFYRTHLIIKCNFV